MTCTGTGADHPSAVGLCNASAATPAAGQAAAQRQQHSGARRAVTGLDATVDHQEGSVSGLTRTGACAEPGGSGGSGGSGGGETLFRPVTDALEVYGAEIG
ncbi:hypothetical protein [Actinacidiphila sp. bgisy160]|uniref:hypothetical protein n=1 Tax=Actinacidiphila sp. bgisy160 TaxID=3413796 RepID=UPI003D72F213